jgi:peptide/nickel transport system permease protein
MGLLMKDAVLGMDYQVVQGAVLVIATMMVLVNIFVDIIYGWIDPRIRYN